MKPIFCTDVLHMKVWWFIQFEGKTTPTTCICPWTHNL